MRLYSRRRLKNHLFFSNIRGMLRNLKQFNLPEIEEKVLKFWQDHKVFEKTLILRRSQGGKPFRFFEGPPTANGLPGIHHILSRVFKDVVLRYRAMRGFLVERQAGWDTHGLPVEIEIEKELGIKNKAEIEKFGIAEFNSRAKASVWRYKGDWEKLTERIGFWLDLKNPYITYENSYIESLWWIFKKVFKKGFLKQSYKVTPYCPRCQTSLSSHELGQPEVYRKVKDPSIYVKFKIKRSVVKGGSARHRLRLRPSAGRRQEYLLVWTTTPWTLPANLAIAIDPQLTYTKYKIDDDYFWSYNPPATKENQKIEVMEKISGKKLVGLEYEPLYKHKNYKPPAGSYKVLEGDFILTNEGTGLVHIAPAFGEDDFKLISGASFSISDIPVTIDERGRVKEGFPGAGKFVKSADEDIIDDLKKRNLLYRAETIEHDFPFCWRCGTALLYLARLSWFIEMSRLRDKLLAVNKKINWIPDYLKDGRFGGWLKEVKDWAISRDRYWGTALPIWRCENGHFQTIGSLNDLNEDRWAANRFFLMRHGEADHNLQGICSAGRQIEKKSQLTEKGEKQADKAAQLFLNRKIKIDFIYSSPYRRTRQTVKIVAHRLGVKKENIIFDERLAELNVGIFNGRPLKEYRKFFISPLEKFIKRPPEGENLSDVRKRMLEVLKEADDRFENKNILIVSHGDPLLVLEGAARHLKNEEALNFSYPEVGQWREINFDNWPYNEDGEIDLHRPFIDAVYLKCRECRGKMKRVKEVADVWFDSGAMPFAAWHYPFENKNLIDRRLIFPADYIVEGIDQTRGWFYTLLAVAALLGKGAPYRNVIALGLVLDKYGQKMSKSKGNVVDPWQIINKYGVDTIRWYFYAINPPAEPKRFDENDLLKISRQFILTLYNSFVFFASYGAKAKLNYKHSIPSANILDRWILTRLEETIIQTTNELERYEIGPALKIIESIIDDLSRWYIRRSRRRFSAAVRNRVAGQIVDKDYEAASRTLSYVLSEISKLLAPFTPFFSEALYQSLLEKELSVHLEDWPKANKGVIDRELLKSMAEIRRLASLALAVRAEKKIKVRQPLKELRIKNYELRNRQELLEILKDEINVKAIIFDKKIKEEIELDAEITPALKEEGILRELTRLVQGLRGDAGLRSQDRIILMAEADKYLYAIIEKNSHYFKTEVGAQSVEYKKSAKFDAELNSKIENSLIWIALRKV